MNRSVTFLVLAVAFATAACGKRLPPSSSLPPPGGERVRGNDADFDEAGNYIGPGSQADLRRTAGSDRVFFDLDSFILDDADRQTLRRHAAWLEQYPAVQVTIEGHCDERGTRDYNIALGERRANSAKNFMASIGVDTGRITVASYGKERPEALGSDEQSYAQNRRAVTVVVR